MSGISILVKERILATYHLLSDHDNSLRGEASVTMIKQVFQTQTKQVNDKDVVKSFLPKVVDIWNSHWSKLVFASSKSRDIKHTAAYQDLISSVLIS